MKKTLIALTAAASLATGTMTIPTTANANPAWLVPALIVGGVVVGGAAIVATSQAAYATPRGTVYVQPGPSSCRLGWQRLPDGTRQRVQICR